MTTLLDTQSFGRSEVQYRTGVSFPQIDYWSQTGLVPPSVRDVPGWRLWSRGDLRRFRVARRCLDGGAHLQQVRRLFAFLDADPSRWNAEFVVTHGREIESAASERDLLQLLANPAAVVYTVIALGT